MFGNDPQLYTAATHLQQQQQVINQYHYKVDIKNSNFLVKCRSFGSTPFTTTIG